VADGNALSSAWTTSARARARYALPGVRGISRAKGTAARDEGLMTESGRPNAVEDILTEAKGPRTRLDSWRGTSVLCRGLRARARELRVFLSTQGSSLRELFSSIYMYLV